jgi:site-specific recombinase XerC
VKALLTVDLHYQGWFKWPANLLSELSRSPQHGFLIDELSPPSVKQHLAAIRMLFDWLVTGHVIETNPAHSVRGPRYTVKKGKTPVLTAEEAHALLESSPLPRNQPMIQRRPISPISSGCATAL